MGILGTPEHNVDDLVAAVKLPIELNMAAWKLGKKGYKFAQELAAWYMLPIDHYPRNPGPGRPLSTEPDGPGPIVPDYHETLSLEPAPLALPEGRGA